MPLRYKKSVAIHFIHRIYKPGSTWAGFHTGVGEALTSFQYHTF